jgi:putative addiction module component (TIGR02574 family)
MTEKVRAIAKEAAQLERHERVEVIEVLLETLEPESTEDPADVLTAWQDEVKRRSEELKSGGVTAIPWDQVKDDAEKLFDAD